MGYERRRSFVNILLEEATREEYYRRKFDRKNESEDTKLRKEIHSFIIEQSRVSKSSKELLEKVQEKFSDEKYQKYHQYFKAWVSHAMREDEER